MAVTPRHGKDVNFKLANTAGTLVNLSSGITEFSIDRSLDAPDVTTLGDNDRNYLAGGLRDATISFSGIFSSTHAEVLDALFGHSTAPTFELSPDGSTAVGRHLLKGSGILTGLNYQGSVGDAVKFACEYQITGAVTSTNH